MQRRPNEYAGMAICAALYGMALAAALVYVPGPVSEAGDGVLRAVMATLAALSFVTAEAVWRVRPWAYRAGFTLAWGTLACFFLPVLIALLKLEIPAALGFALVAGVVAMIVLPMVGYLRRSRPQLRPRPRP